jgi:hypothetical protein
MDTEKEELKIYSIEKLFDDKLEKYKSVQGNPFTLINIRGIVIHQTSDNKDVPNVELPSLIENKKNPYHFIIDTEGRIYQVNSIESALQHCRSKKYTSKANEYFGDLICPSYEETKNAIHPEASADNCTISISIPKLSETNGKLTTNVSNALVRLCSYIINKYGKGLNGVMNILGAYEISDDFADPICFKNDPEYFTQLKYNIEKLRSRWTLHFGGYARGYPTEHVIEITDKKEE